MFVQLEYECSNNQVEYETLIIGLEILLDWYTPVVETFYSQALGAFLANHSCLDVVECDYDIGVVSITPWKLMFHSYGTNHGSRIGVVIESPSCQITHVTVQFEYECSNNQTRYVALIIGLEILLD